jgi:cytochrome c oxidase accessory protein FixG
MAQKKNIAHGTGTVIQPEGFRENLGTMEQSGARKHIFPKKAKGKFAQYRSLSAYVLLAIFFILPFLKINGNPVLKLDFPNREFFIMGAAFYPQDFFVLALGMILGLVGITVFTYIYGRIFCGWICPQTIFMEHLFRKIEYWIDGDRNSQIRLKNQAWNAEKIFKRVLKQSIFIFFSLLCSHLMYAYIVGYERVLQIMAEGPFENYDNFMVMIVFTTAFFFVFAWFREQVCTLVCPYGRLQGVLIDRETINVMYDHKRGEATQGRASWQKNEDRAASGKGDCIDCKQCVVVCPTGIDIRDGQQLECINCTACIDACDDVMTKVGLPKGLIRYASERNIEEQKSFSFTPRMKIITFIMFALTVAFAVLMFNRSSMDVKLIKPAGSTFFIHDGKIDNVYNYSLLNKGNQAIKVYIKVVDPLYGQVDYMGNKSPILLKKNQLNKGSIKVSFPAKRIKNSKQNITFIICDTEGKKIESFKTNFEGPFKITF